MPLRRNVLAVIALCVLVLALGCNSEPFSFVKVSGKITYADGSLIPGKALMVTFVPLERKTSGKDVAGNAIGYLNLNDGTFAGLTTHKPMDGAVPGKYKVTLVCIDPGEPGQAIADPVPKRYQDAEQSPWQVEVSRSSRHFDLTVEKPR
jgi:hypothetical protein